MLLPPSPSPSLPSSSSSLPQFQQLHSRVLSSSSAARTAFLSGSCLILSCYLAQQLFNGGGEGSASDRTQALLILLSNLFSVGFYTLENHLQRREDAGNVTTTKQGRKDTALAIGKGCVWFGVWWCAGEMLRRVNFMSFILAVLFVLVPVRVLSKLTRRRIVEDREWIGLVGVLVGLGFYAVWVGKEEREEMLRRVLLRPGEMGEVVVVDGLGGYWVLAFVAFASVASLLPSPSTTTDTSSHHLTHGITASIAILVLFTSSSALPYPSRATQLLLIALAILLAAASWLLLHSTRSHLILATSIIIGAALNLVKLAGFVAVPLAIWTTIAWVGVGACIALWRTETIEDTMEVLYTASTTHDDLNDDFSSSIEPKTNSSSHPSSIASLVPLVLPLLLSIALFLNSPFITRTPPPPNEDGPYGTTLFSLTSSPSLTTFCSNLSSTPSLPFPSSSSHQRKTALASHPRSGNTLLRELVERVTGWQTSSVYCDKSLMLGEGGFKGECDHESGWFVKTHFPRHLTDPEKYPTYLEGHGFDQAVHLVRNPLDAIYSDYNLAHAPKKIINNITMLDHSARIDFGLLGSTEEQFKEVMWRTEVWALHTEYWSRVDKLAILTLRFEDLITNRLSSLISLITFLLPPTSQPPLSSLLCALELNPHKEVYKSRKNPPFSSWEKWDLKVREEVIRRTKRRGWCRFGFEELLRESGKVGEGEVGSCK